MSLPPSYFCLSLLYRSTVNVLIIVLRERLLSLQSNIATPPAVSQSTDSQPSNIATPGAASQSTDSQPSTSATPVRPRPLRREGALMDITNEAELATRFNVYGPEGPPPSFRPRPLRREGAVLDIMNQAECAARFDGYAPEGPPPSTGPSPAPESTDHHSDQDSGSNDDGDDGRTTFPVSSSRNGNGKKRSREDIDDAPGPSQSQEHADSIPEPAMPSAKRRRAMNGGRAADEPSSSMPRQRSAHDMQPPSPVSPPRPDTPRPDAVAPASTSYICSVVTGVVSSALSHR